MPAPDAVSSVDVVAILIRLAESALQAAPTLYPTSQGIDGDILTDNLAGRLAVVIERLVTVAQ
jgi:hypothetical protein